MEPFRWIRPRSLDEARGLLSETARPKGGGMDLLDLAKRGVSTPGTMVDLGAAGADAIERGAEGLVVGARVTLARLAADAALRSHAPALGEAAAEAATPQVRNVATLAGNLLQRPRCAYFRDPFFDCRKRGGSTCPRLEGDHVEGAILGNAKCCAVHASNLATALFATGATVLTTRPPAKNGASRDRRIGILELFTDASVDPSREHVLDEDELVTAVEVPAASRSAYVEVNHKQSYDWAAAAAAVRLDLEGGKVVRAAVALGAVAPMPWLSLAAAKALAGKAPDAAAAKAAAAAAVAEATPLRDNGWKVRVLRACVERAVLKAAGRGN